MEDTTIEDVFKTFQAHYARKDYPNALLVLQKNQSELSPGLWHYNVGIIKAQTQQWPEARFHFLKSRQAGFNSEQTANNLALTEEKLELVKLEKSLSTNDYLIKASLWAAEGVLTTFALLILVIAIFSLRKKRDYKLASIYAVVMGIPLLLSLWIGSWTKSVVIQPQLVLDGPSVIFPSRAELPAGIFIVTRDKGDWKEIIYPSRFNGWIKNAGLKSLEEDYEL